MDSQPRLFPNNLRTITIPADVIRRATSGPIEGRCLTFAVSVDWPELRLTEGQIVTNAAARAADRSEPFPDRSIFSVDVPYVAGIGQDARCGSPLPSNQVEPPNARHEEIHALLDEIAHLQAYLQHKHNCQWTNIWIQHDGFPRCNRCQREEIAHIGSHQECPGSCTCGLRYFSALGRAPA